MESTLGEMLNKTFIIFNNPYLYIRTSSYKPDSAISEINEHIVKVDAFQKQPLLWDFEAQSIGRNQHSIQVYTVHVH